MFINKKPLNLIKYEKKINKLIDKKLFNLSKKLKKKPKI